MHRRVCRRKSAILGTALPVALAVMTYLVARGTHQSRGPGAAKGVHAAVLVGGLVALLTALSLTEHLDLAGPYGLVVSAAAVVGLLNALRAARERRTGAGPARGPASAHRAGSARRRGPWCRCDHRPGRRGSDGPGERGDRGRQPGAAQHRGGRPGRASRGPVDGQACCATRARLGGWLDVPALVDNARRSGLEVTLSVRGRLRTSTPHRVRPATASCRRRSPTCCGTSGARSADVLDRGRPTRCDLEILDTRARPACAAGSSRGTACAACAKRAEAAGGSCTAGPRPAGGWSGPRRAADRTVRDDDPGRASPTTRR